MPAGRLFALLIAASSLCACDGEQLGDPGRGTIVLLASHDPFPPGVGSYRVAMRRVGGATACGSALASFSYCSTAGSESVAGLCSGDWVVVPLLSGVYESADCSGVRLEAPITITPDPITVPYGGSAMGLVLAHGSAVLAADVTFDGAQLIAAGTESLTIRARRTPHPDVECGTAQSDIVDTCHSFTPGSDFPPVGLTAAGCSGDWTFCVVGYASPNCAGAVSRRGVLTAGPLDFGATNLVTIDTSPLGGMCPF